MKLYSKNIIIVFILSLFIFSCTKAKENKLIGDWDYVQLSDRDIEEEQNWTFASGNKLTIEIIQPQETYLYEASYLVSQEVLKGYFISITEAHADINGKWKIQKLKSDRLQIERIASEDGEDGAYLWKDFTKK